MGFLPIILAILGFVFLWGIVNYQSLRMRKIQVKKCEDEVLQAAGHRDEALKKLLAQDDENAALQELSDFINRKLEASYGAGQSIAEKLKQEKVLGELVADVPPPSGHAAYEEAYNTLQKSHLRYRQSVNSYRKSIRDYNELIEKNPTRMLAGIAGFKSITNP